MTGQDASAQARSDGSVRRPALRRELHFFEATSVSVGVMAPTLAMSVTGVAAAAALGRAAPLAFAVAALGVGLVAYGFVRLAGEFSHAGSVYGFVGNTLGPRPGFLAGWALLGTYLVFPPVSIMGVAIFGRAFLATIGVAAKHGVHGLTRAAALELGGTGIRVNAIAPGVTRTGMTSAVSDELLRSVPLRRIAEPEEIAAAVVWLCSPEASYITGSVLAADGGWLAG